MSRKTQTFDDDFCTDDLGETFIKLTCSHQFSVRYLLRTALLPAKKRYCSHTLLDSTEVPYILCFLGLIESC